MKLKMFQIFLLENNLTVSEAAYQQFMQSITELDEFDRLYSLAREV